jgi:hypothetical protein
MLCGDGVTDMPGTADDVFHPYNNFSPPVPLHQRESRRKKDMSSFYGIFHEQQESKLREMGC